MSLFHLQLRAHIRTAREEDLLPLEWGGEFWAHRELIRDAFERQRRGEVRMLVADADGFPIAQAWIDFTRKREQGVAVIWALRVQQAFWGKRIAGRLLDAAEQVIADEGFTIAELAVDPENHRAKRLYLRHGYVEAGWENEHTSWVRPDGVPQREDSMHLILRKPVAPARGVDVARVS